MSQELKQDDQSSQGAHSWQPDDPLADNCGKATKTDKPCPGPIFWNHRPEHLAGNPETVMCSDCQRKIELQNQFLNLDEFLRTRWQEDSHNQRQHDPDCITGLLGSDDTNPSAEWSAPFVLLNYLDELEAQNSDEEDIDVEDVLQYAETLDEYVWINKSWAKREAVKGHLGELIDYRNSVRGGTHPGLRSRGGGDVVFCYSADDDGLREECEGCESGRLDREVEADAARRWPPLVFSLDGIPLTKDFVAGRFEGGEAQGGVGMKPANGGCEDVD